MLALDFIFDPDVFEATADTARRLPTLMATALKRQQPRIAKAIWESLQASPPRLPDHPFIWSFDPRKQARAARWYFAAIARGEISTTGERYQRTGGLTAAWIVQVDITPQGGEVRIENPADGALYTIGPQQVPSHVDTGWYNAEDKVLELSEETQERIIDTWVTVAAPELIG